MILARITGNAVAVEKHACYDGKIVLVCQPIDAKGKDAGRLFLAVDTVRAGPGDTVLCSREGNTARQLAGKESDPIHAVVMAVVDRVEMEDGSVLDGAARRGPGGRA